MDITAWWQRTGAAARVGLIVGVLLIGALVAGLSHWSLNKEYQVLFADLSDQDASTMVAELDRMKIPYRLEARGTRILVPEELVHKTRLQLVGKNLPLHGAVGFEIFNNTDFGMTEFTQKVNYQRALQGELTRTIMSFDEVQSARVHLALPESSLFKRDQNRPKASITLALKPGHRLERGQVIGIQRLVAAAVPGIDLGDVTVLDQKGVALSQRSDTGTEAGSSQLDTKRQIEEHLSRKIATVLDRAFGAGQGVVSVDVLLNFDQVKVTSEEVLPSKAKDSNHTGVMVRERQTQRDRPATGRDAADATITSAVTNTEVEYQVGRRVEQIVGTPGSVKKISVGIVVPKGVTQDRLDRIRELAGMAAGIDKTRGDGIAVYSLDQMSDGPPTLKPLDPMAMGLPESDVNATVRAPLPPQAPATIYLAGALAIAALLALGGWAATRGRRPVAAPLPRLALAPDERDAMLESMQQWLVAPAVRPVPERAE